MSQSATLDRATPTKTEALEAFFSLLKTHEPRIAATRRKVSAIYRFETPADPYFEWGLATVNANERGDFNYRRSDWCAQESDGTLDWNLQWISFCLNTFPQNDYVPSVGLPTPGSALIPVIWGAKFEYTAEGAAIPASYLIEDLERDLHRLRPVDVTSHPAVRPIIKQAEEWARTLEGRVQITYPQMQGPLTNAMRIMPQDEMLMAAVEAPELLRELALRITRVMIDIIKAIHNVVPDPSWLRPRGRFYQPPHIRGLMVDDYISVIRPEDYLEICRPSWQLMADELGPIYLHTCGPTLQCAEILTTLPGLAAFETAFTAGQRTTTADILTMKEALHGQTVFGPFGLPFGNPVEDSENLTADWLKRASNGGGLLLHGYGSIAAGRKIMKQLGRDIE